ncbi:MAG: ImmA/IrrE family metallo-endopeptidase [Dehalococcoidia bacterium]
MISEISSKYSYVTNEVIALSRNNRIDNKSWRLVKQAILEAASYLREDAGQTSPPINPGNIMKLRCIQKEIDFESGGVDAILVPISGGFIIRQTRNQNIMRRRFSTAHEIGHTFFYNLKYDPPVRIMKRKYFQEEDICYAFARELLMPMDFVKRDLSYRGTRDLRTIIELAKKYEVSPEVAARRLLFDLSEFETSILMFINKRQQVNNEKEIRRLYGKKVRSYLRVEEEAMVKFLLTAINEDTSIKCLKNVAEYCLGIASLEWYQTISESRLMILLNFHRSDPPPPQKMVQLKMLDID